MKFQHYLNIKNIKFFVIFSKFLTIVFSTTTTIIATFIRRVYVIIYYFLYVQNKQKLNLNTTLDIIEHGDHVVAQFQIKRYLLNNYWDVDLQEAYFSVR